MRLLSIAGNHMATTAATFSRLCRAGFAWRVLAAGSATGDLRSGNNPGAPIGTRYFSKGSGPSRVTLAVTKRHRRGLLAATALIPSFAVAAAALSASVAALSTFAARPALAASGDGGAGGGGAA